MDFWSNEEALNRIALGFLYLLAVYFNEHPNINQMSLVREYFRCHERFDEQLRTMHNFDESWWVLFIGNSRYDFKKCLDKFNL